MRGRINIMDLFYAPFNIVHEFYYFTFLIKEQKEKDRKDEEKKKQEEEKAIERVKEMNKPKLTMVSNRLSPAAQAQESRHIKSQSDESSKREQTSKSELAPSINMNIEDLVEALEEGV